MAYLFSFFAANGNYTRISSASCESFGLYSVKSEEVCESAASYLGLADTGAYSGQDEGRPYGCIYASNDWLGWYDPKNSSYPSVPCGSTQNFNAYDCICARRGKTDLLSVF